MKPKEFKEEMRLLVENAQYEEYKDWRKQTFRRYHSVVNGREYRWNDMEPEEFAQEQIKIFSKQGREINNVDLSADKSRINERQKALAFLWEHKELWKDIVALYNKYESYRDRILLNPFLFSRASWDKTYARKPEVMEIIDIDKEIKAESRKLTGRGDIFFLYDSFPSNWLAMI